MRRRTNPTHPQSRPAPHPAILLPSAPFQGPSRPRSFFPGSVNPQPVWGPLPGPAGCDVGAPSPPGFGSRGWAGG